MIKEIYNLLKLRHLVSCALVAVVGLSACSNVEEDNVPSAGKQIQFSTGVSLLKSVPSVGSQLPSGSEIGIFINEDAINPTTSYEQNLLYTADGNGNLAGESQLFPSNGNKIKVSAYYPFEMADEDEYVFFVQPNQTTDEDIYVSDLLYSDEIVTNSNPISLEFFHKLSQISYELVAGNGNPDLTDAKVSILNANTGIEFNRITGTLGEASKRREVTLGTNGGIIVPQTITAGIQFMKIILKSGQELFYTPTEAITIVSNKKYKFKLEINLNEATNIETEVADWGDEKIIEGEGKEEVLSSELIPTQAQFIIRNINDHGNVNYMYDTKVIFGSIYDGLLLTIDSYTKYENYTNGESTWAHIKTGFNYDKENNNKLVQMHEITVDEPVIYKYYTFDYSTANEINITITDTKNIEDATTIETEKITIDNEDKIVEDKNGTYTYDENGNCLTEGFYYDNKMNPYTYLALPRWAIQYCTAFDEVRFGGQNNLLGKDVVNVKTEYNSVDYPAKISAIHLRGHLDYSYSFKYRNLVKK